MDPNDGESGPDERSIKTALVERELAAPADGWGPGSRRSWKVGPPFPWQAYSKAWGKSGRGGVEQGCHAGFTAIPHLLGQPIKLWPILLHTYSKSYCQLCSHGVKVRQAEFSQPPMCWYKPAALCTKLKQPLFQVLHLFGQ